MNLSISNVIINYFLLHEDIKLLKNEDLIKLSNEIENKFKVKISFSKEDIKLTVGLCEDFLSIDDNYNISQDGISKYLDTLEPVYQWFGIHDWDQTQEYYNFLKKYTIPA